MKRGAIKEEIKTALIVILAVSAVFLAAKTGLFNEFFASIPRALSPEPTAEAEEPGRTGEACRPLTIVLTGDSGLHCCVRYSDEALDEVYSKLENLLGEALGSSSEPAAASGGELRSALGGAGVFFDFRVPVPLSALADWLGSEMLRRNDTAAARILLVSDGGDGVELWYEDTDGAVWRCGTASGFAALRSRIAEYQPNGASFAFEDAEYAGLDPYCVISPGEVVLSAVSVGVPAQADAEKALLGAFGYERFAGNSYPEADGTTVYVGDGSILRIYPGGEALFRVTEPAAGGYTAPGEAIELARRAVRVSAGAFSGDARVWLTGIEASSQGACTVTFGYVIDGVRVSGTEAASVEVRGGAVTQARITLRTYTAGEGVTLLPEPQAAAVAQEKLPGGTLFPVYTERAPELVPAWTVG